MAQDDILVLGSAGFVGRRLLSRLKGREIRIHTISTKPQDFTDGLASVHVGSLDDPQILHRILPRCKAVVYLASHSNPGYSAMKPSLEAERNLLPFLRFLEVIQEYTTVHLIYLSSGGAVYGATTEDYIAEEKVLSPLSYYGAGKAAVEKFILAFCNQTGAGATILRPTNFYGPGQPYRKGFGIIPTIFHHLVEQVPFTIWGDGRLVRDYLFIEDFVDLCLDIIQTSHRGKPSGIYNVGAEHGTSINDLCGVIETVTGKKIEKRFHHARPVDVPRSVLGCSKIRHAYEWNAKTSLHEGVASTWKWFIETQV